MGQIAFDTLPNLEHVDILPVCGIDNSNVMKTQYPDTDPFFRPLLCFCMQTIHTCVYEFLATATEGVVHSVHRILIRFPSLCNRATQCEWRYWTFCHCVTRLPTNLRW